MTLRIINSVPFWDYIPDLYGFTQVLGHFAYLRYAAEAYVLVVTDIDLLTSCRLHCLCFGSGQAPPSFQPLFLKIDELPTVRYSGTPGRDNSECYPRSGSLCYRVSFTPSPQSSSLSDATARFAIKSASTRPPSAPIDDC